MRIRPEAFQSCLDAIAARGNLGRIEALDLLQEVAYRGDVMRQTGEPDPFVYAAADLADKLRMTARLDRLDALRNAGIRNGVMVDIHQAGGINAAILTIRSLLHGTSKGGRESIQALWRGLASNWQAVLDNKLRQAGIRKAAISGALDREIAEALWRGHGGVANDTVEISRGGQAAADAILPLQTALRDRLNAAGARIGNALDYAAHTEHDPRKMRRAAGPGRPVDMAFDAWWAAEQPRWHESTFADLVPREGESLPQAKLRFARSVYDALVSGVHMTSRGALGLEADASGFVAPAFEGTHNLARRLSQPRVIHYKDAQAWLDHMRQFGTSRTLTAGVMRTLDQGGRQVALMQKLGTNPAANLNQIIRKVQETYRTDLDGVRKFQQRVTGLRNVMGRLDGSLNIPENEMFAQIGSSVRTWESTSMLGGVGLTHFASIWPTVTSELAHHGIPRLQALGNMVAVLVRGKGSADKREILADLGAYAAGLTRDMHSLWQPEESLPGRISAIANTFMKYTGLPYIFDRQQAGVREMLAHQLGRKVDQRFAELDPHLSMMLGKYGIGEQEWNLLRDVRDLPTADGRAYMTPNAARSIDSDAIEEILRNRDELNERSNDVQIDKKILAFRNDLADKLMSYYGDAADHSVVTSGVRERAALLGSTRPGSVAGELLRFLTQFKFWPVAAFTQVLGREIYMSLSAKEAATSIFTLLSLTAAFGYLRMAVNDVAAGRPVRSPLEPATMLAALAQGGGIGILGDFMFGQINRFGGGLLATLGGPVASDADTLIQIFNRFRADAAGLTTHRNGAFADLWPDLARFASQHVPFNNLIYLKGATDYLLWYHLFEAASPGWWERTNRRLQLEQGRGMVGYSPGGGVPVGVPGVYLKNPAGQTFGVLGQNK